MGGRDCLGLRIVVSAMAIGFSVLAGTPATAEVQFVRSQMDRCDYRPIRCVRDPCPQYRCGPVRGGEQTDARCRLQGLPLAPTYYCGGPRGGIDVRSQPR